MPSNKKNEPTTQPETAPAEEQHVSHYQAYKAAHLKYQNSEKGQAARARYQASEKGKQARKAYQERRKAQIKEALQLLREQGK